MATILKAADRDFAAEPNKIDNYRLFTDKTRVKNGIKPENLNFDLRRLNPGEFSAPFHFHRYAEELFMVVSGSMTLRTFDGLQKIAAGDVIFCEKGKNGAHQFYNHAAEPCVYMDIRTFVEQDICEYPDSGKILLAPSFEIFSTDSQVNYFQGETDIRKIWQGLEDKKNQE